MRQAGYAGDVAAGKFRYSRAYFLNCLGFAVREYDINTDAMRWRHFAESRPCGDMKNVFAERAAGRWSARMLGGVMCIPVQELGNG